MNRECSTCKNDRVVLVPVGQVLKARRCAHCDRTCALCDGVGYTFSRDELGYEQAKPCTCQSTERRIDLLNRAQLPARYSDASFPSFRAGHSPSLKAAQSLAFRFVKEYREGDRGLLFWGPPGSGKTHLIVAMLRYLSVNRGVAVRYIEFVHLLSQLKARFNDPAAKGDPLEDLVRIPVLAIDELGKNRGTDWEMGVLDELISKRYNANRTTLCATNLSPLQAEGRDSLPERVGERIASRLNEMCWVQQVEAPDYRIIKARQYD